MRGSRSRTSPFTVPLKPVSDADVFREIDAAIPVFSSVGDKAGLAHALTLAGKLRFWGGEAASALPDLERAVRHAHEAGDRAQETESLQYVCAVLRRGPMPVDQALRRLEEIRPRADMNPRLRVVILETWAPLAAMQGDFETARDLIAEAKATGEAHGLHALLDTHTRPAAGDVELLAGDLEAAEHELRLAGDGTERVGEFGFWRASPPPWSTWSSHKTASTKLSR